MTQTELGFFVQDEWRIRPNLTFTAGLRYEYQNEYQQHDGLRAADFLCLGAGWHQRRLGSGRADRTLRNQSWSFAAASAFSMTVSVNEQPCSQIVSTERRKMIIASPIQPCSIFRRSLWMGLSRTFLRPTCSARSRRRKLSGRLRRIFARRLYVMTAINIERQLPYKFTFYLVGFNYRGKHLLRLRNINAPLPGTYNPANPAGAIRPNGNIGDIYYYESAARFNDYRMFGGLRRQMSKGFSLFVNFGTGSGKTDTDCIFASIGNCFPANSYNATNEYSRVGFIPSFNFFTGGTIILPKLKINLNPFIVISTGRPFNIVTGRDTNGDGLFTERPAFATAQTDPADLRRTKYGDFDLNPGPGQALIPRNYGIGPSFFSVNLGISRAIAFGEVHGCGQPGPGPTCRQQSGGGGGGQA